jgi:hypothetical protein
LSELVHFNQSDARLYMGWRFQGTGQFRLRSRFLASSLERASWEIVTAEGIGLAGRNVAPESTVYTVPAGCEAELQGAFLMVGGHLSLADLCQMPFAASIRHFCVTQRLQPSLEFLEASCAKGISVAYMSTTDDVTHGLVLVGPASRAPNLTSLWRKGLISEPLWDSKATQVWEL